MEIKYFEPNDSMHLPNYAVYYAFYIVFTN